MTASSQKKGSGPSSLATNRKALRDYTIVDRFEAGIELRGAEVKSIRAREVSLNESFARVEGMEVYLHAMHVMPYKHSRQVDLDPRRPRRLLLHRAEIRKLIGQMAEKGRALIPLRLYLKHGRIKLELALCEGKHAADKRDQLRRKTADREAARAIAHHSRR